MIKLIKQMNFVLNIVKLLNYQKFLLNGFEVYEKDKIHFIKWEYFLIYN